GDRSMPRLAGSARCVLLITMAGALSLLASHASFAAAKRDNRPLHARIDALVESAAMGPLAAPADDAEFVRRIYLDLVGMIPTVDEVRAFIDDSAADKRARLIDRLLASPEFARHMMHTFDAMLMERRTDKYVTAPDWQAYLYQSFLAGKPYDALMRELLVVDGAEPATRPAAKFLLNRECEPHAVTRDVGRMYFGMDLTCAQCHDHPVVEEYVQDRYYGLQAFLVRTSLFNDKKAKTTVIAEKADGETNYKSVFTAESLDRVPPRVPLGAAMVEPAIEKGQEYVVAPAKDVRGVPKFSRRAELARLATDGHCATFNRNAANRLWAHMLGRGIVHPLDYHHCDNPPSHPELLALLADELRAANYDVREFLREVALSQVYQRSCVPPAMRSWQPGDLKTVVARQKTNVARASKQLAQAEKRAEAAAAALHNATEKSASLEQGRDRARSARATATIQLAVATARFEEAQQLLELSALVEHDRVEAQRRWDTLVERWTNQFQIGRLKPLAPEALAISLMQATGYLEAQRAAARKAIADKPPSELTHAAAADRPTVESQLIEARTYEAIRRSLTTFVSLYGGLPGEDFAASLDQALFFGNAGVIDGWIKATPANLADRLQKATTDRALAEELYLSVFARMPSEDERARVRQYLESRKKDRPLAIEEMIWALLSSNEFRFNH
ncbi:MAG TPA: DUF1549 domain-containing protein, partial [Pirellulales bacterium]|nr:DUF1549 domain-containing protein [Pirellulales bacterium]